MLLIFTFCVHETPPYRRLKACSKKENCVQDEDKNIEKFANDLL